LAHWHKTSGLIQGDISLRAICEGTLVAAAIALVGAAFPAWRCANLPIADTMRAA
jgi:ABC-type lipoprotein release transport system permease subunit